MRRTKTKNKMKIQNLKRAEELSRELETLKNCIDLLCLRETVIVIGEPGALNNAITDDWIKGSLAEAIEERIKEIKEEVEEL